jgi:hypothetical protein
MSDFRLEDHPVVFLKPRLSYPYAWVGHIPFAYLLIDLLRPRQLVELGTDSGNSYLAFCQAVQILGSDTRCTAIDSWQGDPHARRYGEGVYETLKRYHDPRYAAFSRMHRSFFIDALGEFEDGSIDLLHIDGLHTYEAVSEDFNTWLPKLSDRAVVIFHDSQVRDRGFGVARFLDEIRGRYRIAEFEHSNGLGIALVGANVPEAFVAFMDAFEQRPEALRRFFNELGDSLVDDGGRPGGARAEQVTPDVTCRVFYRDGNQDYDESRVVMAEFAAPEGPLALDFAFPEGVRPEFIRIDPADHAGVFRLSGMAFSVAGTSSSIDDPAARVVHVSGDLLPDVPRGEIRLVAFTEDPHVEFSVRDVVQRLPEDGDLQLAVTIGFDVVLNEPSLWSLARAQEQALQTLKQTIYAAAPVVQAGAALGDIATAVSALHVAGMVMIPGTGPSLYTRGLNEGFGPERRVRGHLTGLEDVAVVRFDIAAGEQPAFVRVDIPALPGAYRLSNLVVDGVAVPDLRRRVVAAHGQIIGAEEPGAVTVASPDSPPYIELDVSDLTIAQSIGISAGRDLRPSWSGLSAVTDLGVGPSGGVPQSLAAVEAAAAEQAETLNLKLDRMLHGMQLLNEQNAVLRGDVEAGRQELAALTRFEQSRGILRRILRRARRKS